MLLGRVGVKLSHSLNGVSSRSHPRLPEESLGALDLCCCLARAQFGLVSVLQCCLTSLCFGMVLRAQDCSWETVANTNHPTMLDEASQAQC